MNFFLHSSLHWTENANRNGIFSDTCTSELGKSLVFGLSSTFRENPNNYVESRSLLTTPFSLVGFFLVCPSTMPGTPRTDEQEVELEESRSINEV